MNVDVLLAKDNTIVDLACGKVPCSGIRFCFFFNNMHYHEKRVLFLVAGVVP